MKPKVMGIYFKAKIPNVRVTDCRRDYDGSITIDANLLIKYGIQHYEQVHVLGVSGNQRAITYAIPGDKGVICCNGGLANLFMVGDIVNIVTYEIK